MAIKTFSTGEVLTASDTNTFLANAGLVHVATVSWSGATQVDFLNVFTSTYTNYRLVFDYCTATVADDLFIRCRDSGGLVGTNDYLTVRNECAGVGTVTAFYAGGGYSSAFRPTYIETGTGYRVSGSFEFYRPNVADFTSTVGHFQRNGGDIYIVQSGGIFRQNTVFTGFSLIRGGSGTFTGKASVYGYRIA